MGECVCLWVHTYRVILRNWLTWLWELEVQTLQADQLAACWSRGEVKLPLESQGSLEEHCLGAGHFLKTLANKSPECTVYLMNLSFLSQDSTGVESLKPCKQGCGFLWLFWLHALNVNLEVRNTNPLIPLTQPGAMHGAAPGAPPSVGCSLLPSLTSTGP